MTHEKAVALWRDFHTDMLHDVPMTKREEHLAAACFWFGIATTFQMLGSMSIEMAMQSEAAAIASLACVQADDAEGG